MATLDQLKENESGIILNISDEQLAVQLLAMGFILGEQVRLERVAPLHDPIIVSSGTNYLSIRKNEAKLIEIDTTN
ncbi:MAG: FeoA domain-containing protein [Flavobacteriales bacterium]|nr:FeoA domain-containing protein [Flavobacteriales bacterium]HRN40761.1 FeoA domain-containing protein [Vicingus sp.]MBV6483695.1 hypothetical protein [Flavobacteriales bacterium]MBX2958745.1 FeoA domain-containing protein [Flavobacteriales bacterium]MCL4856174.1 FeoA domain-containing protein [Flavobacteriales bacterium]